jgi:hypothetical protein
VLFGNWAIWPIGTDFDDPVLQRSDEGFYGHILRPVQDLYILIITYMNGAGIGRPGIQCGAHASVIPKRYPDWRREDYLRYRTQN